MGQALGIAYQVVGGTFTPDGLKAERGEGRFHMGRWRRFDPQRGFMLGMGHGDLAREQHQLFRDRPLRDSGRAIARHVTERQALGEGRATAVLAVAKARNLAVEGFHTLLTCYNRPLADHLVHVCEGIENLEDITVLKVEPFRRFGTPMEIIQRFCGKDKYLAAIRELEPHIYSAA